ncbi:salicylate hydroxylase [Fusarium acutatum]|uniref:Salicylate hydroxylase n=1 Tax=Fusarium acutatum TaxID=78861 RepID=A0A8H4NEC3_9HYPO|nr:salicylate hydroxylase [Fusarium acutatum]
MPTQSGWRALDVAVIGGGIGGQAVATSLRRQGHKVTIYERADFAGEVGASISCAANGTRWLEEWKVNIEIGDPVTLRKLISRDWKTGEPISVYDLKDYKERWGYVYYMFHRQYMHRMLMDSALGEGEGPPAQLIVNHQATDVDVESGEVTFANGKKVKHDLVIGADGIGSTLRSVFGIKPDRKPATCTCLHTNVDTAKAVELGLVDYSQNSALEYWGGYNTHFKIVLSPCNGGKLLSYYCFFPREAGDLKAQTWDQEATLDELLDPYPDLDRAVFKHLEIGYEIRPWRLWLHEPYDHWTEGVACIMGDAAHPMMPDQSQGACQAIEDAAAIGLVFSKKHFNGDIRESLKVFEEVRKPRATKVQAASARARENINERIGFSSNTNTKVYNVATEDGKLTIDEMNMYNMKDHVANVFNERRLKENIKSEPNEEDHKFKLGGGTLSVAQHSSDQYAETAPQVVTTKKGERVIADRALTLSIFTTFTNIASLSLVASTYLEKLVGFWAAYLLPLCATRTLVPLLLIFHKYLVKQKPQVNILPRASRVIVCAGRHKFNREAATPVYQSEKFGRQVEWDDKFVFEIKRGLQACKVMACFVPFHLCMNQITNNLVSQAGQMRLGGIPNDTIQALNSIACVLLGPIMQRFVYPIVRGRGFAFGPIARITWAFIMMSTAMAYAAGVQKLIYTKGPCYDKPLQCEKSPNDVSVWIQSPVYFLLGVAEILGFTTLAEYSYSEAPRNMRSLVQAMAQLSSGAGSALGMAFSPLSKDPQILYLYTGLSVTMITTAPSFWLMFRAYDDRVFEEASSSDNGSNQAAEPMVSGPSDPGETGEKSDSVKTSA